MTLRVAVIRSAVNQNGNAFGICSLRSVSTSLAAYDCISFSEAGLILVRSRIVLAMTGKKTIIATITTRGIMLSGPNQLIVIGVKAMIGIVFVLIAIGRSVSWVVRQRAITKPT